LLSLVVLTCLLLFFSPVEAMETADPTGAHHDHGAAAPGEDSHHSSQGTAPVPATQTKAGLEEQLGEIIPLDTGFIDEHGMALRLGDYITLPTILVPVFYFCPQSCSITLGSLATALDDVELTAGEEYQVLAFSFDAEETPQMAKQAKGNYLKIFTREFPGDAWPFVTGSQEAIDALLASIGYSVQKTGPHAFLHPNAIVVLSPTGKIIRYLYGTSFLPFDIAMAISEAEAETPQLSIRRLLTYCFDYDRERKTYVFQTLRVAGVGILVLLALFFFFFLYRKRDDHGRRRQ